mmetsp:Transcript_18288/g.60090  ORF Transcript_18288/g.60090 Transcript_18288/m.60090 type:complete len:457 (-) Transcript_18288:896-2266(-)
MEGREVDVALHLLQLPLRNDLSSIHDHDPVSEREVLDLMRHEQTRLLLQLPEDTLVHELPCHVRVDSRERVVEEVDVSVAVDRASKLDPRLLPARQVDPSLSDLSLLPGRQDVHVRVKGRDAEGEAEALGVQPRLERHVLSHGGALDPAGLGGVGDGAGGRDLPADCRDLLQDGGEEGGFATADLACYDDKLSLAHRQVDVLQRRLVLLFLRCNVCELLVSLLRGFALLLLLLVLFLCLSVIFLLLLPLLLFLLLCFLASPREVPVLDRDHNSFLHRSPPLLPLLLLLPHDEALDAPHGDLGPRVRADRLGDLHKRPAEHVDEDGGGEDARGVQPNVVEVDVGGEGEHGGDDCASHHRCDHHGFGDSEFSNMLQLHFPSLVTLEQHGVLPCHELDHFHPLDHLVEQLHPCVRRLHPQPFQLHDLHEDHGQRKEDEEEPAERDPRCVLHLDVNEVER